MKTSVLSLLLFATILATNAQQTTEAHQNDLGQDLTVIRNVIPVKTIPLRDMPTLTPDEVNGMRKKETRNLKQFNNATKANTLPNGMDPALQTEPAFRGMAGTGVNFNGQAGGFPPDPTGAAGPDHYVQAVNTAYRVYSKTGTPMGGPFDLSSLWPGSQDQGDPIVLYDKHADRWFISQFSFFPLGVLLAVSESGDPLGAYHTYDFPLSGFPDYPKYSVWWDGYYMTSNSNETALVFERQAMLNGAPADMVSLSAPNVDNGGFTSVLPADADGDLPPNGTPCYFFNLEDDAWPGVAQDQIKIYEMSTDWNNPGNTEVVQTQVLPTEAFSTALGNGFANIPQPNTNQKLDGIPGVFMFRAQHTRWVQHSSIVLTHVVDVDNTDHAGVRWYELRDNNDGNWSIYQQSTYSPDNAHRWMSSAAMDSEGNIGMAYSFTDVDNELYPGIRFTGRLANDPLGEMTFFEESAIDGTSNQTNGDRYGDYAHMSVDPSDGTTFWYTGEWLVGSGGRTRIFNFNLEQSIGIHELSIAVEMNVTQNGNTLDLNSIGRLKEEVLVDIIDMNGKQLISKRARPIGGTISTSFDVSGLANAVYFVRMGNASFQKVERVFLGE